MPGASTSSGTSNTQTHETQAPWSVQAPYLTQAFSDASSAMTNATANQAPGSAYSLPQRLTAGTGSNQQYLDNMQQSFAANYQPVANNSVQTGEQSMQHATNFLDSGLQNLSDYQNQGGTTADNIAAATQYAGRAPIQGMVQAGMQPAIDMVNQQINPGIDAQAAGSGGISGSRDAIQHGIVAKGLAQDASNMAGTLTGNAYSQGLTLAQQMAQSNNVNRLSAMMGQTQGGTGELNAGNNITNSAINQAQGLFNIGNTGSANVYQTAQRPLTNDQQMYQEGQSAPFDPLKNFYNVIGANNWGKTTDGTKSEQTTSTPSAMSSIGSGMSMLGGMKSDARMKTDIQNVGTLNDGQNVYRYRYVGNRTWHLGLLAQEVEKLFPEAVTEIFGVKHVNYDLATRAAI
jgi:Chaperone of endosialidase